MQCSIDTPDGRPAVSIESNIIIPVSQDKSIKAHKSRAPFLAIDILKNLTSSRSKERRSTPRNSLYGVKTKIFLMIVAITIGGDISIFLFLERNIKIR